MTDNVTQAGTLLPCPMCGSGEARGPGRYTSASFSGVEVMDATMEPYIWCGTCCLRTRTCDSIAEAVTAWNTRVFAKEATPSASVEGIASTAEMEPMASAVSDDAIKHLQIRSLLNRAIYKAVRDYRLNNMRDEDGYPYPLVDLMSNPAPSDIGTGEMEMVGLVDDIEAAVTALPVPSAPQGCLLDDLHNSLHRGEKCPECGHDPECEA